MSSLPRHIDDDLLDEIATLRAREAELEAARARAARWSDHPTTRGACSNGRASS